MKKTLLALCLCLLSFSSANANDLEIQTLEDISWRSGIGYNLFEDSLKYYRVSITIKNNTNENIDFAIAVSKGNENKPDYERKASSEIEPLEYQVYTKKNPNRKYIAMELDDIDDKDDNLITDRAKKNKTETVYAYIYVPEEQIVNTGTYSDLLTFKLYKESSDDDYTFIEEKTVQLSIDVQKFILADFTDNSGNLLQLNFDELEEGKTEEFDLRVQSNSGYQLLAYSLNQQFLILENSSLNKAPYSFIFDDDTIDLTENSETLLVEKRNKMSPRGTVYNSEIIINALPPLTAGTYEDKITIILREL